MPHLIEVVRDSEAKEAHLHILSEAIDTTMAQGRQTFHLMMDTLAEFERSLTVERTQADLMDARKRECGLVVHQSSLLRK